MKSSSKLYAVSERVIPRIIEKKAKTIQLKFYEDFENLATGEIKEFKNTSLLAKKNGLIETIDNYTILWSHIEGDYYKQVSKTYDNRTC